MNGIPTTSTKLQTTTTSTTTSSSTTRPPTTTLCPSGSPVINQDIAIAYNLSDVKSNFANAKALSYLIGNQFFIDSAYESNLTATALAPFPTSASEDTLFVQGFIYQYKSFLTPAIFEQSVNFTLQLFSRLSPDTPDISNGLNE